MKKTYLLCAVLFFGLAILGTNAVSAQVQLLNVTFVSANGGSDTNSCSRSAPCRQIQRGINNTTRGGTVVVLDSGEYNAFSITQSINVIAEKGVSAIVGNVQNAAGASIDEDGTNSQIVTIRGLTFVESDNGIEVNALAIASLTVEDCSIIGTSNGIYAAGAGRYTFKNITVAHADNFGVIFSPAFSGTLVATIDDSRFEQNGKSGVELREPNSSLTIRNSLAVFNSTGFWADKGKMVVENSVVANNSFGIISRLAATVSVSNSTISHNGTGFRNYSSTFRSFGNNQFSNNSIANTSGAITAVSAQ